MKFSLLIDLLFPPRPTDKLLRSQSLSDFSALIEPRYIDDVEALLPYTDKRVGALIWELKYHDSILAAKICGILLGQYVLGLAADELAETLLIVPVPLHKKREKERGYNQCERLAQEMLPI